MEDWERTYNLKTSILRRISQYTGFNFKEILELPYSYFLLLNKESWIASYQSGEEGLKILKDLWRLQQTESDDKAIKDFSKKAGA